MIEQYRRIVKMDDDYEPIDEIAYPDCHSEILDGTDLDAWKQRDVKAREWSGCDDRTGGRYE